MIRKTFQHVRPLAKERIKTFCGILLALTLCTIAIYAVVLAGSFKTIDDEVSIVDNEKIRHLSSLKDILTESFFGTAIYYRPLVTLSFMLEYQLAGLRPALYYLTNIFLHLGNTIFLLFIFNVLLKKRGLAFATALLFLVHPLHWEAVANIAGRSILLSAFGQLASFWFYLLYVETRHRRDYVLALIAFAVALLSKESAIVLPIVLAGYEFWLTRGPSKTGLPREMGGRLIWFWVFLLAYFLLRNALHITNVPMWSSWGSMFLGIATFLYSVLVYLRLFVLPLDLHFDRAIPYFTDSLDVKLWATLGISMMAVCALMYYRDKLSRRVKFFLFWAGISLLPVAQFFPLSAHSGYAATAEHFLYVSLAGLAALTALVVNDILCRAQRHRISPHVTRPCVVALYGYLMLITFGQNLHAVYELSMFKQSLMYNPHNTRVLVSYGLALAKAGLFAQAEDQFRKILVVKPWDVRARINLAKSLCDQDKCLEAIAEYEAIGEAGNLQMLLDKNLNETYDVVIAQYRDDLTRDPENSHLHYSLGIIYAKRGQLPKAMNEYRAALQFNPRNRYALYNLGLLTQAQGPVKEAARYFRRVIAFGRSNDHLTECAYRDLINIYERQGQYHRAKVYRKKADRIATSKRDEGTVQ